jgi:hypothetical protein
MIREVDLDAEVVERPESRDHAREGSAGLSSLLLCGCMTQRVVETATCGDVGPILATPTAAPIRPEVHVLALSAGGPWGGFGAGFLNGWSEAAARSGSTHPRFDIAPRSPPVCSIASPTRGCWRGAVWP